MTPEEKTKLLKEWMKLKKAEDKAKASRIKIEAEIEAMYGEFDGKSKSFKEEELGFTVNVKRNSSIKLDQDKWVRARNNIPDDLRPEIIKFDLDVKGFEYLKEHNNHVYKIVSDCVTIKDNKTSIKVEKI